MEEQKRILDEEEEARLDREYRREVSRQNLERENGIMGYRAPGVIPTPKPVQQAEQNAQSDSGNSSGAGAVSGTDSESEVDTSDKQIVDLSSLRWTPQLESNLEEMLIRNAFDFD